MTASGWLDLTVADYLDRVAAPGPAPSAGAVAATTLAMAAGLVGMAAGLSVESLPGAEDTAERARDLMRRAAPLGERDAAAYAQVLEAQRRPRDDPARPAAVREALRRAAEVPLEIAALTVEVAALAADVARRGNPRLRGDAQAAHTLAVAAGRVAADLVAHNIADPDDPARRRAGDLVARLGEPPDGWGQPTG